MATIFKYKNEFYQALNLDKKLKRLKVSKDDVEILYEGELNQSELEKKFLELSNKKKEDPKENWHDRRLYYYINKKTGETISSIYSSIEEMKAHDVAKNKQWYNDYERISEG